MKDNDTLRNMLIAGAVFALVMMIGQKFLPNLLPPPTTGPNAPMTSGDVTTPPEQAGQTNANAPGRTRPRVADADVAFELTFCNL